MTCDMTPTIDDPALSGVRDSVHNRVRVILRLVLP